MLNKLAGLANYFVAALEPVLEKQCTGVSPPGGLMHFFSCEVGDIVVEDTFPEKYKVLSIVEGPKGRSIHVEDIDSGQADTFFSAGDSAYTPCLIKIN